jgi:hypothetical protein
MKQHFRRNTKTYRAFYSATFGGLSTLDRAGDVFNNTYHSTTSFFTDAYHGVRSAFLDKISEVPAPRVVEGEYIGR